MANTMGSPEIPDDEKVSEIRKGIAEVINRARPIHSVPLTDWVPLLLARVDADAKRVADAEASFSTAKELFRAVVWSLNPLSQLLTRNCDSLHPVASFGREVLAAILADRNFFDSEDSPMWCELLAKFGYAEYVDYDPELHGMIHDAWPGQKVWIFTDAMQAAAKVSA